MVKRIKILASYTLFNAKLSKSVYGLIYILLYSENNSFNTKLLVKNL